METLLAAGTLHVSTEPFRAPELLCGLQDYGGAIDVWSLGVVVYQVAAGDLTHFQFSEPEAQLRLQRLRDGRVRLPARLHRLQPGQCH